MSTTTTIFYVYTGVVHPDEWMFQRPLLLKEQVKKRFQKQNLVKKKNKLNNNLKICYKKT